MSRITLPGGGFIDGLTARRAFRTFAALRRGAIAQLGERLHGMQEVGGSIPPGSTNLFKDLHF